MEIMEHCAVKISVVGWINFMIISSVDYLLVPVDKTSTVTCLRKVIRAGIQRLMTT